VRECRPDNHERRAPGATAVPRRKS
jgi:hypothetical protein